MSCPDRSQENEPRPANSSTVELNWRARRRFPEGLFATHGAWTVFRRRGGVHLRRLSLKVPAELIDLRRYHPQPELCPPPDDIFDGAGKLVRNQPVYFRRRQRGSEVRAEIGRGLRVAENPAGIGSVRLYQAAGPIFGKKGN